MAEDYIDKALSILFWIFFIVAVVLTLWYLFGDSPLLDQVVIGLASAFFVEFLKLERTVAKHSEQIKNLDQKLEKGLSEIKELIKSK